METGTKDFLLPVARDSTRSRTPGSQQAAEESGASLARAPGLKGQAEGQSSPCSHSAQADSDDTQVLAGSGREVGGEDGPAAETVAEMGSARWGRHSKSSTRLWYVCKQETPPLPS